jgi:ParB-like chromosome segregation protein Spo0J
MKITNKKIEDLIPYANNSRVHSDAQIAQIAASIKEFGFRNPVLVDGNGILAGHGRVLAARKLGLDVVPTIDCSDMSDIQKKAYVIADNKLALNATWDNEILALEISAIQDAMDLDILGFDPKELKALHPEEESHNEGNIVLDENKHLLLIECDDERHLQTLYDEINERGLKCKIMS